MTVTIEQLPTAKVTAGAAAGAAATLVVIVLHAVTGADVPAGVEGALVTLFSFAAGYVAPGPTTARHRSDD